MENKISSSSISSSSSLGSSSSSISFPSTSSSSSVSNFSSKRIYRDYELENEKQEFQERSTKRQRELKKNAYREIFDDDTESASFNVLKDKDNSENDYTGIEDETYDAQFYKIGTSEEIPLDPFNLHRELSEGRFDDEGNYVEDPQEIIKDPWYEECLERDAFKTEKEPKELPQEVPKETKDEKNRGTSK